MINATGRLKSLAKNLWHLHLAKKNRRFIRKVRNAVSRKQKPDSEKAILVVFVGGLGDFFIAMPLLKAVSQKEGRIILLGQEASGYTRLFNEENKWFSDFIPLGLAWKDTRAFANKLGRHTIAEVYNIGPTGLLLVEGIISGLKYAKKYTLSSRYMRIENYPISLEERDKEMAKYDFFIHGNDEETHYDVQSAFAHNLGLNFPDSDSRISFPRFPSNLVPENDYFILFLNELNDQRDPGLGVLLDIVKHIFEKTGWILVLLGGRDDHRSSFFSQCVSANSFLNLRGKTTIQDYVELTARAKFVICSDASIAHIANAYETDSVVFCAAMYGNSLFPYQWGYGMAHQLVIQASVPCHDCHRRYNGKIELPGCSKRYLCADMYSTIESIQLIDEKFFSEALPLG